MTPDIFIYDFIIPCDDCPTKRGCKHLNVCVKKVKDKARQIEAIYQAEEILSRSNADQDSPRNE